MCETFSPFNLFIFCVVNPTEAVSLHSVYITHTHTLFIGNKKQRAHIHTHAPSVRKTQPPPTSPSWLLSYDLSCEPFPLQPLMDANHKHHCKASETKHCNRCVRLDNLIFHANHEKQHRKCTQCMNFIEYKFPI